MTEYYYTINITQIEDGIYLAYSPQFPGYSVAHIDLRHASALLVERLISIINQYIFNGT